MNSTAASVDKQSYKELIAYFSMTWSNVRYTEMSMAHAQNNAYGMI